MRIFSGPQRKFPGTRGRTETATVFCLSLAREPLRLLLPSLVLLVSPFPSFPFLSYPLVSPIPTGFQSKKKKKRRKNRHAYKRVCRRWQFSRTRRESTLFYVVRMSESGRRGRLAERRAHGGEKEEGAGKEGEKEREKRVMRREEGSHRVPRWLGWLAA